MEHRVVYIDQEYLARFGEARLREAMQNIGDRYVPDTPETTTDLEKVQKMARQAISGYSPRPIDDVRAAGWYNYDHNH